MFTVTQITATQPKALTKRFSLVDGSVLKTSVAQLVAGRARLVQFASLADFSAHLATLPPTDALVYGVAPGFPDAPLFSEREHAKRGKPAEAITRTRKFFQFKRGAGVFMLDYDAPKAGPARMADELVAALCDAAPCLRDAQMLWRPSVSSGIVASDGTPVPESHGQRIYIPVANAALIPEAGKALSDLLWAAGYGWIEIGKAGQALMRTLVDTSVWQPERIDFCAPPILGDGLTRTPLAGRIMGDESLFDLQTLVQLCDGTVQSRAGAARKNARKNAEPDLLSARWEWAETHAPALHEKKHTGQEKAKQILYRAAKKRELTGEFLLIGADGTEVPVADLLDNPAKWHGQRFADPLEPDYGGDRRVTWANLRSGGRPYLYSHAHGGRRFYLVRPSARIELAVGSRASVVDSLLDLLRERGELYDFGESMTLARVTESAHILPVGRDWFVDHLDRIAEFFGIKMVTVEGVEVPTEVPKDAPLWAGQRIIAKDSERGMARLDAAITAPILRRDGSILSEPGHDAPSRLLLVTDSPDLPNIPLRPDERQVREAFARLWWPFRLFPLKDEVDRGVLLAGLLTSVLRASLPTAPGFAFDAPAAGTGKTLLAQSIGALGTGETPTALAPPSNKDSDEARKRLFATLRTGEKILLWDNVRESLGNAALDAFLTAPVFGDRVLGVSETASLPNRVLFLATGNNLRLIGDTCRRILPLRIDSETEQPYAREFAFDPLQTVLAHRLELVADALTLVRGYISAGRPRMAKGRTASFETWDDLVRQPVCWLAAMADLRCADKAITLADPNLAIERAFANDPESAKLAALLIAVRDMLQHRKTIKASDDRTTVAQLIAWATAEAHDDSDLVRDARTAVKDAAMEIAEQRGAINPRMLGRWIEKNAERRLGGLRFVQDGTKDRAKRWMVVAEESISQPSQINSSKLINSSFSAQTHPPQPDASGKKDELMSQNEFLAANPNSVSETEIEL